MQRLLLMLGLVIAGEAIFGLPFQVSRYFRSTVLDVFALDNKSLGDLEAIYGMVAMAAYFPGGALADRFSARRLLASALVLTALGGVYMGSMPSLGGLRLLWAFYGISTILLFWAALIRTTREWGGLGSQGAAYGLLDAGRGAVSALLASGGLLVFSLVLPDGHEPTLEQKTEALQWIIYGYAATTMAAAVLIWFVIPENSPTPKLDAVRHNDQSSSLRLTIQVLKMPLVWLQALIVICAYVGFKGTSNYGLYAEEVYGMTKKESAQLVTLGAWVRPLAALGAGLLADRIRSTLVVGICFALLLACDLYFALVLPEPSTGSIFLINLLLSATAVYALRGVYFALMQEARIPLYATGTAVGLVSVIGYTPDIFVSLIGGRLLDASPGPVGHQHYFMMLAAFAGAGVLVTLAFAWVSRRVSTEQTATAHD